MKIILAVIGLLGVLQSIADTKVLLLDGGASSKLNYYRFYNNTRVGYEVARKLGYLTEVYAANGTWSLKRDGSEDLSNYAQTPEGEKNTNPKGISKIKPKYPPVLGGLSSSVDLKNALKNLGAKSGDRVIVQMTGHGNSDSSGNPYYRFFGKDEKWEEIAKAFRDSDPTITFQIQTSACYGGGVHALTRDLPNVCTSSAVPYFASEVSDEKGDVFTLGFWNSILSSAGKKSFAAANIEAFLGDFENRGMGVLSSFDYLAFVLKKSPYDSFKYADRDDEDDFDKHYQPLINFTTVQSPYSKFSLTDKASTVAAKVDLFEGILVSELPQAFVQFLSEYSRSDDETYREYVGKIKAIGADASAENDVAIQRLNKEYASKLEGIRYYQSQVEPLLRSLREFQSKADTAQKTKLKQLLECEWGIF